MSLSISDGSDEGTSLEDPLSLRDREIWFPDIPDPHLAVVTMDRALNRHYRPSTPISLALFGTDIEAQQDVRRIAVKTSRDGKLLSLEVKRGDDEECVRLGYDRAEKTRDWTLDFDNAAGEEIMGMEVFYHSSGWQMGFKVTFLPPNPLPDCHLEWQWLKVNRSIRAQAECLTFYRARMMGNATRP